jgi:hypothetical protein
MKQIIRLAVTLGLGAFTSLAQQQPGGRGGPPGGPHGMGHPPVPPIMKALDTDGDGELSARHRAIGAGFLNVLKPPGMTSHDVVDFLRRQLPARTRVGHAGTLDPAAAGVLVVCVGAATRLTEYLMEGEKRYRMEATLGVTTDSLDVEGTVMAEHDASAVTEEAVRSALASLVGPALMAPPMYSAAQVGGRRLYELARQGIETFREPMHRDCHRCQEEGGELGGLHSRRKGSHRDRCRLLGKKNGGAGSGRDSPHEHGPGWDEGWL